VFPYSNLQQAIGSRFFIIEPVEGRIKVSVENVCFVYFKSLSVRADLAELS